MKEFCLGMIRHIGYAGVCLAALLIATEKLVPGFVSVYLHPYALLVGSVILTALGSWELRPTRTRRMVGGVVCSSLVILVFWSSIEGGVFSGWLIGNFIILSVAFFLMSVYPKEV